MSEVDFNISEIGDGDKRAVPNFIADSWGSSQIVIKNHPSPALLITPMHS